MDMKLRESAPPGSAHSPFVSPVGIVLLAAGQSKRMGVNKQLLPWKGKTVLHTVCRALREGWLSSMEEQFVEHQSGEGESINRDLSNHRKRDKYCIGVIGRCDSQAMQSILEEQGFLVTRNERPEDGQGSSIALGVERLVAEQDDPLDGVLCSVADQPLLTPIVVRQLIATFRSNPNRVDGDGLCRSIVVPLYGPSRRIGNPVVFGSYWFDALRHIEGDQGGKTIIHGPGKEYVQYVWISDDIGDDVDTPEDFQRIRNRESEDV